MIIVRMGLSAALGFVVGLQRARSGNMAGTRTFALIALGSALFTSLSVVFATELGGTSDRVASNILQGIGFLGGGMVIKEGFSVRGLTTAAGVWAMAAVGMAVGLGHYVLGVAGAAFIFALFALGHLGESEARGHE